MHSVPTLRLSHLSAADKRAYIVWPKKLDGIGSCWRLSCKH
jgi:hypothetical protein